MRIILLILLMCSFCAYNINAQGVSELNNILSTYSHKIKTNNFFVQDKNFHSGCIYNANYMQATQNSNKLTLTFGFGWDEKYGYIHKCTLIIDLSTASFYTGFWSKRSGKWQQNGDKMILTIEAPNGMDLKYTGEQNYNRGTKQDLISKIQITFGSEPIVNRILNVLYSIQSDYKGPEVWLLPEPEPQKTVETEKTAVNSSSKKVSKNTSNSSSKKATILPTKKYGKYGQ